MSTEIRDGAILNATMNGQNTDLGGLPKEWPLGDFTAFWIHNFIKQHVLTTYGNTGGIKEFVAGLFSFELLFLCLCGYIFIQKALLKSLFVLFIPACAVTG